MVDTSFLQGKFWIELDDEEEQESRSSKSAQKPGESAVKLDNPEILVVDLAEGDSVKAANKFSNRSNTEEVTVSTKIIPQASDSGECVKVITVPGTLGSLVRTSGIIDVVDLSETTAPDALINIDSSTSNVSEISDNDSEAEKATVGSSQAKLKCKFNLNETERLYTIGLFLLILAVSIAAAVALTTCFVTRNSSTSGPGGEANNEFSVTTNDGSNGPEGPGGSRISNAEFSGPILNRNVMSSTSLTSAETQTQGLEPLASNFNEFLGLLHSDSSATANSGSPLDVNSSEAIQGPQVIDLTDGNSNSLDYDRYLTRLHPCTELFPRPDSFEEAERGSLQELANRCWTIAPYLQNQEEQLYELKREIQLQSPRDSEIYQKFQMENLNNNLLNLARSRSSGDSDSQSDAARALCEVLEGNGLEELPIDYGVLAWTNHDESFNLGEEEEEGVTKTTSTGSRIANKFLSNPVRVSRAKSESDSSLQDLVQSDSIDRAAPISFLQIYQKRSNSSTGSDCNTNRVSSKLFSINRETWLTEFLPALTTFVEQLAEDMSLTQESNSSTELNNNLNFLRLRNTLLFERFRLPLYQLTSYCEMLKLHGSPDYVDMDESYNLSVEIQRRSTSSTNYILLDSELQRQLQESEFTSDSEGPLVSITVVEPKFWQPVFSDLYHTLTGGYRTQESRLSFMEAFEFRKLVVEKCNLNMECPSGSLNSPDENLDFSSTDLVVPPQPGSENSDSRSTTVSNWNHFRRCLLTCSGSDLLLFLKNLGQSMFSHARKFGLMRALKLAAMIAGVVFIAKFNNFGDDGSLSGSDSAGSALTPNGLSDRLSRSLSTRLAGPKLSLGAKINFINDIGTYGTSSQDLDFMGGNCTLVHPSLNFPAGGVLSLPGTTTSTIPTTNSNSIWPKCRPQPDVVNIGDNDGGYADSVESHESSRPSANANHGNLPAPDCNGNNGAFRSDDLWEMWWIPNCIPDRMRDTFGEGMKWAAAMGIPTWASLARSDPGSSGCEAGGESSEGCRPDLIYEEELDDHDAEIYSDYDGHVTPPPR